MEKIGVLCRLVATITCFIFLGFNVGMCSVSDALIKTYVSSTLPSNDDLVSSAMLKEVIEISTSEWDPLVLQSELPVMVIFTAHWCGPCRQISPILNSLDSDYTGRFKFYTVDIDDEPAIAQGYGIRAIPATIVIKGGDVVARVSGVDPSELRRVVEKYV